ncbi:hybrid sensor histidine kinase/response regulator transcription factor [Mucilaginibacter flavus]|uniref:hybrid sensor histidine kinase/response regulator transcription factor n=1 Tax=Mucilaginibacter flavus TaxID=931504 RepID=UPI0025B5DCF2|nr:hybrid sensor histidine kinase/response regulator transcription factor [Mucilaginibacter flavus]MDN3584260.1 two-component regulator propeller domain-containing protein [Mucilaginibacter flavus]
MLKKYPALFKSVAILRLSTLMLLVTCAVFGQAPKLKFSHINSFQGLSNSTVECIYQDSRGFMWFGTRDGLNRYDGYQITVFKNNPVDVGSISDNYIRCLYEDKQHRLWIGTSNGLNLFNPFKNTFARYKYSATNKLSISGNTINCIYNDKQGNLWIGTTDGSLNLYQPQNNSFGHFYGTATGAVNCVFEDSKNTLWIGTERGLKHFDRRTHSFNDAISLPGYNVINLPVNTIQEDHAHNLWLGIENGGLMALDFNSKAVRRYQHHQDADGSLGNDQVKCLLIDRKGNIWAGGINGGLNLFNPQNGLFSNYQNVSENPGSLSQRTVSAIFEDNQSNLWVGTHRAGVNLYTPKANKFKLLQNEPEHNSLSYNDVRAFCEDEAHQVWIGTDGGGINIYNPAKNTFSYYRNNPNNTQSLAADAVLDIYKANEAKVWVSTWGGGLNCLDKASGSFRRFTNNAADKTSISSNYVQQSFKDSEGNFWVATYYGGLNVLNEQTLQFSRFTQAPDGKTRIQGNNIVALNEDHNKNLWIGTDDGGLNCYNLRSKKISHYFNNQEKLPDLRVIFIDHTGRVWLGQNGLYLFNPNKNKFEIYTDKAGLGIDIIKAIQEDATGNFWISGSNGLTKFNPASGAFTRYNIADGLQGQEFEAGSSLKAKNGTLYFGGVNGFNVFNPAAIKANPYLPPVYVTALQVFDKIMKPNTAGSSLTNDISLTKKVKLSYKQSSIGLHFAALNYTATENNKYQYRLDGFEPGWHFTNDGKASYTNLSPGDYTFIVRAANNDGLWNNQDTSLMITITPPFWATWWFRVLMGLFFMVTVYQLLRFKENQDLRKLEESRREEMHQLQLQFFTNISHEFRTPLSLILGPLEALLQKGRSESSQFYEVMYRNANRLLLLINELMDFRKVETGTLQLKVMEGNLDSFVAELAAEFNEAASQKNISLKIQTGKNTTATTWFDRQILEKIVLNLLNNSIKYTPEDGCVIVEALDSLQGFKSSHENELILKNSFRAAKYAYIRISDNGIGISKESIQHLFERYYRITETHLGSGIGLAFVKSLALLHKGDIYVYSQRHAGTDIIIALPVAQGDYQANEKWTAASQPGGTRLESIQMEPPLPTGSLYPSKAGPAGKHKYRILVVEDNDEIRAFIKNSLEEHYTITEAVDGNAGFAAAKSEFPDLIISDVMMPGMNGIDLCQAVKQDIDTSHIPLIMLTAKTNLQAEIEGIDSGADMYLPKPISINLLTLSIRNIFEQRQKLKDRYQKDHHIEARALVHSSKDKEFIDKLLAIIDKELSNPDLDVDSLCESIGMSRTKLYHKIKEISGQAPNEFIRSIRLKKAVEILTHEDVLLTEVIYRVGIQTQSYFTKAFKKEYGKTPTQFIQDLSKIKLH